MADTHIQWTDKSWNPTTGCDKVSAGCDNCYALTMAKRLKGMGQAKYQTDGDPRTSGPGFGLKVHPGTLADPFRWRKPSMVFVNSMSDLFHAKVPLDFIQRAFAVMAATPQHTYQILTKRARRLRRLAPQLDWPSNVWMGVSVESEDPAVLGRVDELRRVPAAVRFLSCEPLLAGLPNLNLDGVSWLIVGGESGGDARPMDIRWAESIVDRSCAANVAVHVKQLGSVWAQQTRRDTGLLVDPKGGDWDFWPEHLRIREYPVVAQ
jgi:protein gp37